jgi:Family of unknown function (DUF5677)
MPTDDIAFRYTEMRGDLRSVLDHCAIVSTTLANHSSATVREHNAKLIFSKLVGHGISLYRLSPTGIVPSDPGATEFWDVSSTFCICRALVEAFDALAYVAIEAVSDEERDFRVLLWQLHAEDRKLQALKLIQSKRVEVVSLESHVSELRERLASHSFIKQLDKPTRSDLLGKKIQPFHIRTPERNRRNHVNHEYYTASYILLSAHTHTYPMAIQQLTGFQAGEPESLRLIALPTQYAIGFISKAVLGVNSVFPRLSPVASPSARDAIEVWSAIVENGISRGDEK